MSQPSHFAASLSILYIGGPTALIDFGGLRLLTDPTFDSPGDYPIGSRKLTKTVGPAVAAEALGPVDAVLLSHDQHPDNLDRLGREYLSRVPLVLSTASAQQRLGGAVRCLPNWGQTLLPRSDGGTVQITGTPARHGPEGSEPLVGEVTGFVLSGAGLPTVYVSGDNASLDVVRSIASRLAPVDIAILFAGGAQTALLGDAYLTLTSPLAADAVGVLGARQVVPVHFEHWAHFTQGADTLRTAFKQAGLGDRLRMPTPGEWLAL